MRTTILKFVLFQILVIIFLCGSTKLYGQKEVPVPDLSQYVDPYIGTEGGGNSFIGPALPFSMVKLGPDCYEKKTNSGYHPEGKIHGFSHVHTCGTGGGPKYGNVLVAPIIGDFALNDFSQERKNEQASVGYYTVDLIPSSIKVELTSTPSVGFHKYGFPQSN